MIDCFGMALRTYLIFVDHWEEFENDWGSRTNEQNKQTTKQRSSYCGKR